jgi:hypothetical protein
MNQQRGGITSSERKPEKRIGLVTWNDDSRQYPKLGEFVLNCLVTAETSQRLYSSSESKFEEGRGLVAWNDDSRQYPKLGEFVLDCLATAETRQRMYSIFWK